MQKKQGRQEIKEKRKKKGIPTIDTVHLKRAALIFLAAIVFLSLKTYFSPVIKEGAIEEKSVTGIRGDESFMLLRESYEGVEAGPGFESIYLKESGDGSLSSSLSFPSFSSSIPPGFQVNESLEAKIKATYPEIKYTVRVRLCVENEITVYRLSREEFNRMKVGTVAKFEVDRTERDLIKKVLEI